MTKAIHVVLAGALLAGASAASAQTDSDVRCLVVSNAFARDAKEADQKKAAESAIYFYLGRIGDTVAPAQLKTMLDDQTKALTDETAGPAMDKCIETIQARVKMVQGLAAPAEKSDEGR